MSTKNIVSIIIVIVLLLAVYSFGGRKSDEGVKILDTDTPVSNEDVSAPTPLPVAPAPKPVSGSISPQAPKSVTIEIFKYAFPPVFRVKKGTIVIWANKDYATHNVVSDIDGIFKSDNIKQFGTFAHTFNTTGSFSYHCSFHPDMRGTIVVTE